MTNLQACAVVFLMLQSMPVIAENAYADPAKLAQAIEIGNAPLIIDVRSPEEYQSGHVPGAMLLPIQAFPGVIERLPTDKQQLIVVYCEIGARARLAKIVLTASGYQNVQHLDGNMRGWRERGLRMDY
jgi:phage shock protein E